VIHRWVHFLFAHTLPSTDGKFRFQYTLVPPGTKIQIFQFNPLQSGKHSVSGLVFQQGPKVRESGAQNQFLKSVKITGRSLSLLIVKLTQG
jgi:hypothetical protein